jgi:hypothetical protein
VVNGTRSPTLVNLTSAQINAVVAWTVPGYTDRAFCSGTLISDRFILTAAHCLEVLQRGVSLSQTKISFGQDETNPILRMTPSRYHQHPTQDLLIVELSQAPANSINVAPIPITLENLANADVGSWVEEAGFGLTNPTTEAQNGRFFVKEQLYSLTTLSDWEPGTLNVLEVYGGGSQGVCNGDSGGPSMRNSTRTGDVRVLGALHGGEQSCVGHDFFTRVDLVRSWVEGIAGATPGGPGAGCGSVTAQGSCDAPQRVATYCEDNTLRQVTCSASQVCRQVSGVGFRCVESSQDPCGGVTYYGSCDGQGTLRWCQDDQVRTRPCSQCGETCRLLDATTGYGCATGGSSSSGGNGQGQTCDGSRPCPTGSDCLAAQGWTTGFCSAPCTGDGACAFGGPGTGACVFITAQGGQVADHCGIMCDGGCPAAFQCDTSQGTPGVCLPTQGGGSSSGGSSSGGGGTDLGQVCSQQHPCTQGSACLVSSQGAAQGMCAPTCDGDEDCVFPGPGTGACIWSIQGDPNSYCGVLCSSSRQCPSGFSTVDEPTQGGSVCVCEVL